MRTNFRKAVSTALIIGAVMCCLYSCADSKTFYFKNGKEIKEFQFNKEAFGVNKWPLDTFTMLTAEPYGWANYQRVKIDSVIYEPSIGNIVWSIILFEILVPPVYFSGWAIMEPVQMARK